MGFDTAYEAISADLTDPRWAFGTGFEDPLAGVDRRVPDGVDAADLGGYLLMLADDALVMSHRLQQWLARAPELEEETALANIALDLLGQARLLLTRAGTVDGTGRTEDDYAFGREVGQFRNVAFVEPVDADFAGLVGRLLVFSAWRLALLRRLDSSRDPVLAAVAARGVAELTYHRDYAAQWVVRLGAGTEYSRDRMRHALGEVVRLSEELFQATALERRLAATGVGVDPSTVREEVLAVLAEVLAAAELPRPSPGGAAPASGRAGVHTEAMTGLLAELQEVARAHPGARW